MFAAPAGIALAEDVDLELVLAVDISYSMDPDEQVLQRQGYIEGITSPEVIKAISDGPHAKIAVAYVEWAGASEQETVVNWQMIDSQDSAKAFAAKIGAAPLRRAYRTSISGALAYSQGLFDNNGFEGIRRVIDISGDGPNNQGPLVMEVRSAVLDKGIVINGLPIMLKRPNPSMMDLVNLDSYYRDCVIGGPGAFVVAISDRSQFVEAIRTKLVLEIAARQPEATIIRVQDKPQVSCTVGEALWDQRFGP